MQHHDYKEMLNCTCTQRLYDTVTFSDISECEDFLHLPPSFPSLE